MIDAVQIADLMGERGAWSWDYLVVGAFVFAAAAWVGRRVWQRRLHAPNCANCAGKGGCVCAASPHSQSDLGCECGDNDCRCGKP